MIKIVALNDQSKDEEHQEDETITKEAQVSCKILAQRFVIHGNFLRQETIAISEYIRALSLKQSGNASFALGLFEDLLRTQVLSDVSEMCTFEFRR